MLCGIEFSQNLTGHSTFRGVAKVSQLVEVYISQLLRNLKTKLSW